MPAKKIVDESEVRRWFDEGRTHAWMVEQYRDKYGLEVVGSMFGNFRRRRGLDRRSSRDDDLIPWAVEPRHRHQYPVTMLRQEARRRSGLPVTDNYATRLRSWLLDLHDRQQVVDYDPSTGFTYVPRSADDSDIIRRPSRKSTHRRNADT